ncbi:XtrA/YqaO family protein [Bacillus wiedmannii]|uniref:XtrA/YqaO family protein n=1 Tax=Bacillus wiedmannii TaxID=1890302 RepID=UPI000BFA38F5|nr:XtrA/YqaO family protein [Bacillus wiedmannii]PGE31572.1 terminase [Bacillus wiedmannii]PHA35473.1 terminase [Bacillus wiedmannii]
MRIKEMKINIEEMKIEQKIESGKIIVLVLDGTQGKVKMCEAVEHGFTIIETVKGQAKRIEFEESELF